MKKMLLLCALVVGFVFGQAAHADTYSLSFAGCFGVVIGPACFGTPVTNGASSPGVTDITFTTAGSLTPGFPFANQSQIDNISGTVNIGGDVYTIGALATGLGGDNKLNDGLFTGLYLDNQGIDFLLSGSGSTVDYTELNLTYDSVQGEYTYTTEHCAGGLLLLGRRELGKSAFAKALGNQTGRPTIILDVGALMGSLVGTPRATSARPCASPTPWRPACACSTKPKGALRGHAATTDSGVSARLFGTFLTWLSDHSSDVFVCCTSNDIFQTPAGVLPGGTL